MVINDFTVFPGAKLIETLPHDSAIFEADGVRLTVVMANRLPLEKQLGADLIYCNETLKSFVIVQYKAMESVGTGSAFRLPNALLDEEIGRMGSILSALEGCTELAGADDFRLTTNPCFLKFCPRIVFNPDNAGLVPGMYLPLGYWRQQADDPRLDGPRGGRALRFENVGRYLDNRAFATLVASGWAGTTAAQSQVLETVIREIIETGRTVTLAIKSRTTQPTDAS